LCGGIFHDGIWVVFKGACYFSIVQYPLLIIMADHFIGRQYVVENILLVYYCLFLKLYLFKLFYCYLNSIWFELFFIDAF